MSFESDIEVDKKDESDIEVDEKDESDIEIENIDTTNAWDSKKSSAAKSGQIIKLSTDYNKKIRLANKIKNKYLRKNIGSRNKSNRISAEWLKAAGYLGTKTK